MVGQINGLIWNSKGWSINQVSIIINKYPISANQWTPYYRHNVSTVHYNIRVFYSVSSLRRVVTQGLYLRWETWACTPRPGTKIACSRPTVSCAGLGASTMCLWCNEWVRPRAAVHQGWAPLGIIFLSCDCPLTELPLSALSPKTNTQLRDDK